MQIAEVKMQHVRPLGPSRLSTGPRLRAHASKGFGPPPPPPKPSKPKQEHAITPEEFKSLASGKAANEAHKTLHDKLGAVSVVFLGDSGELNREVAKKFSEVAGYGYLNTASIIEECIGKSILEVEQEEGRDNVVVAEASVIEQTALQLRSSISLLGGGWGASARAACWRHLYGAFTVWLDVSPEQTEEDAPQRGAYSEAEVQLRLKDTKTAEEARETVVENIVSQAILALMERVKKDKKLPDGKRLYVKLGCRGDWPDIQEPSWVPPELTPIA